jgi:hypothetical protein
MKRRGLTALGNPVVPELKLKNPQRSAFLSPSFNLYSTTCSLSFLPCSSNSPIPINPSIFPSNKKTFSFPIPASFAAAAATCMLPGTVNKYFAPAVFRA